VIFVREVLTATDADVLNGTDLENIPEPGYVAVLAASSQADGTLTITGRNFEVPVRQVPLPLRTNGQPNENEDTSIVFPVPTGGKVILDYTEVTAATAVIQVMFTPLAEAIA
jgi:hypothetical protein